MYSIDLSGKVAIVTGGSEGLGYAIADILCQAGANVVITGRRTQLLEEASARLSQRYSNGKILALSSDASRVADIRNMAAEVEATFGKIDILVNNAGTNIPQMALDVTEEDWDRIMNVNLKGLFFCCQEIGRRMVQQQSGRIINIASQMGLVGYYKRAAYCASKGGVVQLTKVLAVEWAKDNVLVNAVGPTFTDTPLAREVMAEPAVAEELLQRIPMGKLAQPEDVAHAVLYLSSDMGNFVTGHTLLVDGGWVAW
jgi:NAD(P)-dependent dehydrogenase (short-subunit alcohol dehydrogenase family)